MPKREVRRTTIRRSRMDERAWRGLLAYGRRQAREAGIRTEEDVERLIDRSRR